MENANTVFGSWKIGKGIGTGSYGKVFEIENEKGIRGVYKIMKLPVSLENEPVSFPVKTYEDKYKEIRKDIYSSIRYIQINDGGKYFVNYEECYFKHSPDYKTMTIGIRMEKLLPLSDIIKRTSLDEEEVIRLAVNICRCLEKCRGMDYVYVNLKPDNIFVTETGVKLGDFGNFGEYEPTNLNIAMRKSQEYEAPETVKFGEINQTVDTYSLGILMYGLLNENRLPFISRFSKVIGINDINEAIEKRCSNYIFPDPDNGGSEIKKIILKACNPSQNMRYQTPTQMKNELLSLLGERAEENPFVREENPDFETIASPATATTVGGNVATFEYTDKKEKKKIERKKLILLLTIMILVLALLIIIGVKLFSSFDSNQAVNYTENLTQSVSNYINYG